MKGRTLDARARLTPLLGTAMAGVAAGCLLLFAVFARQAVLDVNDGFRVLPELPSTAIRGGITLLTPLQTGRTEVAEGAVPAAATPAPTVPQVAVAAPVVNVASPSVDERDGAGRFDLGALPTGKRLVAGADQPRSDEWWIHDHRGDRGAGRADASGKGRGYATKAKAHPESPQTREGQSNPGRSRAASARGRAAGGPPSREGASHRGHPERGHAAGGPPSREGASHRGHSGHGRGGSKPHSKPEGKPDGRGQQGHGADNRGGSGKEKGGPPEGRGRP